ncbi:MAG: MBL fold metallo-hydrolase [Christensenellaceae bacterium]|jgi:phosphoribosyl 1,2-cyclic phosphodiesterase|nr:MBL fold metallo-hydrolase [Christensenellaceae bacterium]
MRTVAIASGSKGNCIYVEAGGTRLLVDLGITCSIAEGRLWACGIDPASIDGILITHEHTDHCAGVQVFAAKYGTKIYIHQSGAPYIMKKFSKIHQNQIVFFASSTFFIDDVMVGCEEVPHDSNFCLSFSLNFSGKKVSVITDVGHVKDKVLQHLYGSDVLYIEANHDEQMLLENPKYSLSLKNRIMSPKGHLSNTSCGLVLVKLIKTGVKQVVLSHLSEENNTPELAYLTVKNILLQNGINEGEHVFVDVAFQNSVGTFFEI